MSTTKEGVNADGAESLAASETPDCARRNFFCSMMIKRNRVTKKDAKKNEKICEMLLTLQVKKDKCFLR
jgi:hypothetical protein